MEVFISFFFFFFLDSVVVVAGRVVFRGVWGVVLGFFPCQILLRWDTGSYRKNTFLFREEKEDRKNNYR